MSRTGLIALMLCISGCSSSIDIPAQRLVLLQYSSVPTTADSLAASQIGGGPATIYPIIATMTLRTRVATSAFAALNPKPTITDGDSIAPLCAGPSVSFTTRAAVTASDSAAAAHAGIRVVTYSHTGTEFIGDFDTAALSSVLMAIGGLAADSNITAVALDLGSCFIID